MAAHLKILIVTDAWAPQVNGVVRTLETLGKDLGNLGHTVRYITPLGRRTFPLPTYPEIRLALFQHRALTREIREFAPDAVHIATEGSLGLTARRICLKHGIAFTTAFHTRFAEYVHARFRMVPERVIWRWLRWFHHPATAVMVATETLRRELADQGFQHLRIWSRGVDIEKFHPIPGSRLPYEGPIWLYVGRVAVEKNI
ncbi:MAG TPA: glycosyltransferase, partial [Rhizomicrobium sp.]|nr:glycosyltransferase [Rhizomicrobium sp.]